MIAREALVQLHEGSVEARTRTVQHCLTWSERAHAWELLRKQKAASEPLGVHRGWMAAVIAQVKWPHAQSPAQTTIWIAGVSAA